VVRREEARRRAAAVPALGDRPDARFVDVPIFEGSPALSRRVANVQLPTPALLVSIRRGRQLVIPHGDTVLEVGDVVTALCPEDSVTALQAALSAGGATEVLDNRRAT
jgi:Trk K+ transport system NAD-binding subunit